MYPVSQADFLDEQLAPIVALSSGSTAEFLNMTEEEPDDVVYEAGSMDSRPSPLMMQAAFAADPQLQSLCEVPLNSSSHATNRALIFDRLKALECTWERPDEPAPPEGWLTEMYRAQNNLFDEVVKVKYHYDYGTPGSQDDALADLTEAARQLLNISEHRYTARGNLTCVLSVHSNSGHWMQVALLVCGLYVRATPVAASTTCNLESCCGDAARSRL